MNPLENRKSEEKDNDQYPRTSECRPEDEMSQQEKWADINKLFPPRPGAVPPKTMEEWYSRLFGGDDVTCIRKRGTDRFQASIAKMILRRQAGELMREECFDFV